MRKKYENLSGEQLNPIKEILAFEATKICRGEEEALKASKRENAVSVSVDVNANIVSVLVENGICKSNGEARRLIDGNGVRVDDVVINKDYVFTTDCQLSIGKKKKMSIQVKR